MARKRLSDLLREEAQKPGEVADTENQTSDAIAATKPATPIKETVQLESAQSASNAALQPAIEAANQREADLNQQLAIVQADLKTQTNAAQTLDVELKQAQTRNHDLETELATAKQTVLQLAAANAHLKQELEQLKQPQPTNSSAKLPPLAAKPSAPFERSSVKPSAAKSLTQQEILRRRQADSLAHPVFPNEKSVGQFFEQDLGWVD